MPLVRLFARAGTKIPLEPLQASLCSIWGVKPATTKLIRTDVADWTHEQFHEDVYVSIRAKATPERTREVVLSRDAASGKFQKSELGRRMSERAQTSVKAEKLEPWEKEVIASLEAPAPKK